ncbi:Altered inheritance of mitochondria protein 6 [Lasiodiplodia hormozganensis]|uniref:Altered inheritance of mitochondria protein 6 n=1 Tax=Lasiodiplodia hormozganensis TaxID=869390 RepID=A0AA39WVC3_9PEZI|nr:Altered inheritance of mitochondria protein 6 [Lasiodiplodia hormozganensis]
MAYHDDDCDSDSYQSADELLSTPDPEHHQPATPLTLRSTFQSFKLRPTHTNRRHRCHCWLAQKRRRIILVALLIIGVAAISLSLTYLTLTTILLSRLAPPNSPSTHRLHTLLSTWRGPADSSSPSAAWLSLFTDAAARSGVRPVPCHSHNDYWRPVPLFSALAAGCVGVEADIWLPAPSPTSEEKGENMSSSSSPPVGHTRPTLDDPARTLRSLYIDPLLAILSAANAGTAANETAPVGVFATSPATTLVLLLDFKEWDAALWEAVVQRELAPLRERGWLTYWSEEEQKRVERPVTAVVTGAAAFEAVMPEGLGPGGRDVFFDAPLERLEGSDRYNAANSYYASVKLSKAVGGRVWGLRGLSGRQAGVVRRQVVVAAERGLVSRYWGTPGWPVVVRNRVWETLVESGVGVLNVDELTTAVRWDWRFCTILGITICN